MRTFLGLLTVSLALLGAGTARAETVGALGLGSFYDGVEVTATGDVWAVRAGPSYGESAVWRLRPRAGATAVEGVVRVLPRPDGRVWVLSDTGAARLSEPDGSLRSIAGRLPAGAAAVAPDGSLLVSAVPTEIVRVETGGAVSRLAVTPPPRAPDSQAPECETRGLAVTSDGRTWLADGVCGRLFEVRPDGTTSGVTIPLGPRQRVAYPEMLRTAPDGSLWFHVDAGGLRSRLAHLGAAGVEAVDLRTGLLVRDLAVAPDGTAWVAEDQGCALTRVRGGTATRVRAPFPVRRIATAADGSLWPMGWSRLAHVAPAELRGPAGRCDERPAEVALVDGTARRELTLRSLRRHGGVRIRSSEPATFVGATFDLPGQTVTTQRRLGRRPSTIRFGPRLLDRIAAAVRRGRFGFAITGTVIDRNGVADDVVLTITVRR